ncbi:hypothetical protein [Roseateles puraquae]|uniref:DUF3108 domain-containing protein n=1 Tax=Roseateles puraquae TaxID=431059 RepID=A0A254NHN4_9BURK|nr:hypothetical protein [Roseateles puraquae]MDG0853906.1 hypothetical protein [Roseateles puraquae]OWR04738.1 hypothetical protein CDO81_09175 [Roseateles puraquae]
MRAPAAPTRALPRAAALALLASVVVHAALLLGERPRDEPRPARAVTVAVTAPPRLPMPLPETTTPTPPTPPTRPLPKEAPTQPTAPAPVEAADAPPPAAETPPLRLAGPAAWAYRLRQGGQDGEALLDWRPEPDGRYSLRLTRRIGERTLPAWESLGQLGSSGLAPERFALQRGGRDRQAVNFDAEERLVSFSASPAQLALPEGAQDRLSWWLQLAALVQANPAPGGRWRVWVAGLRGELREWVFEAAEATPEDAGSLHLRRQRLGEHDPGVELWLDPARGYWPVRLRQGDPETRGFEIWLSVVNS